MAHYDVKVYARRGDQPGYTYLSNRYRNVRYGKAIASAYREAQDISLHEGRTGMTASITYLPRGAVVRVGICKFVVRIVQRKGG